MASEEVRRANAYPVLAAFGLILILVAFIGFSQSGTSTVPVTSTVINERKDASQEYKKVVFKGTSNNSVQFIDRGMEISFPLANSYHVFQTTKLPYRTASIGEIKSGSQIDLVVVSGNVVSIFYK